ncbi:uncharacterized protein CIMG_13086 [Coccidioides immitis RS]|uniref:Uncharacterized protein n=1 Tax=Coccidioides immitis (strain RS) TaxID=246410 RepID=A0A0D8JU47_COCIM|nr:uncharacterized protein CIMG_13086 [Coccidioides immitis RS]KJF60634.1 hypothetical protein CIMG_13086 [Coccidioides immitis RS]
MAAYPCQRNASVSAHPTMYPSTATSKQATLQERSPAVLSQPGAPHELAACSSHWSQLWLDGTTAPRGCGVPLTWRLLFNVLSSGRNCFLGSRWSEIRLSKHTTRVVEAYMRAKGKILASFGTGKSRNGLIDRNEGRHEPFLANR